MASATAIYVLQGQKVSGLFDGKSGIKLHVYFFGASCSFFGGNHDNAILAADAIKRRSSRAFQYVYRFNIFRVYILPQVSIIGLIATGKVGMGNGDFKLFAAFGAWFGWTKLPLILLLSSFMGAAIGIIYLRLAKKSKQTPIPFGPFLCLAALVTLFWGDDIIGAYLGMYTHLN